MNFSAMKKWRPVFLSIPLSFLLLCCTEGEEDRKLFSLLSSKRTGIDFENKLEYSGTLNPIIFHSFYNGGVAAGDINNDGLPDLFFCGNLQPNRLYLNLGNLRFQDITISAGFFSDKIWSSGATFADVNGDGLLDLFVSISADFSVGWRSNELYINNGNLTFTEKSAAYNLTNLGFSTHAAFFDYDRDGDLDCYLLGNSGNSNANYYGIKGQRNILNQKGGNKLLRNDDGKFVNVTADAKIYGSAIGYGLGVTISDLNKDGWPDIYVSNDYFEKDYLYINKKNGTFEESLEKYIREISYFSMGADAADINNDSYPEIFVTDMLPELEGRIKAKTSFENYEKYQANVANGYYHQFLRNTLQLNLGPGFYDENGNPEVYFSEVSRLSGIHATDWSWSSLITDLDNDGWKDIYVSNGMAKDVTDQDFIQFIASDSLQRSMTQAQSFKKIIDLLPSQPLANYVFKNNGDLTFVNKASEWGLDQPVFSNGSVYADLDNDGDMDLVTNNINSPASVYVNNANELYQNTYLKILLKGDSLNRFAIGAKVTLYAQGKVFYQEVNPTRGFMSCVDARPNFGLGNLRSVDSLLVEWPNGKSSSMANVVSNQTITLDVENAKQSQSKKIPVSTTILKKVTGHDIPFNFVHEEKYTDFYDNRLFFYMTSARAPYLSVDDVNGDGKSDVFISGNEIQSSQLLIQNSSTLFQRKPSFESSNCKETESLFFDADNDGDKDLYVCHSGGQIIVDSTKLQDRLYFNDGKGNLKVRENSLPSFFTLSSCVAAADFDGDGDSDLFVGSRMKRNNYGYPANGLILQNDGKGNFKNVTEVVAPELFGIGMITDAAWIDIDNDKKFDLAICGEYMPITILKSDGRLLTNITTTIGLNKTSGWWNEIFVTDVNDDGYKDIIAGNHGLNSRFKASPEKPITLYVNDFDNNSSTEAIVCTYNGNIQYPMALRHDLVVSLPFLKKKFLNYENYKEKTMADIFSKELISTSYKADAYELRTGIFLNDKNGKFNFRPLPTEAQFSPVFGIASDDFDHDGRTDLILGGNFYQAKPEVGINDASYGTYLKGDGNGGFNFVPAVQSGLFVRGAVRDIKSIDVNGKKMLIVSRNNGDVEFFKY